MSTTTHPGLIDRRGLLHWADSISARSDLPRLVRLLVLESGEGIVKLRFPAGEGVSSGGWDGTVYANADTPFVPAGLSLWELSVDKSPNKKADQDYAKRSTTPDGSPTSECTYIAVCVRPWQKRDQWARVRTAEGKWKKVQALGVDEIETWLESAPITHFWISEQFGLRPHGLETAQTWWNRWSSATDPPFPTQVVLAGRDEVVEKLRAKLSHPGELITVGGSRCDRDDVFAFVASVGMENEATDGGALLSRIAFVEDVTTWRRLRDHPNPLVLVACTDEVAQEFVRGTPHVLIIPYVGLSEADIELPPIDSVRATQILKDEGVESRLSEEAGKLARLSLRAARRQLAHNPELHDPAWARPPVSKTVRYTVLLGGWREDCESDFDIIDTMVGIEYDDFRDEVAELAAESDPLVVNLGGTMGVASHSDAWMLLQGTLRKDDLEAFHKAARVVFLEPDPDLELAHGDRWRASLVHGPRSFSRTLRNGFAETLVLLGAYSDRPLVGGSVTGTDWAGWIVREVLEAANQDETGHLWRSLADVLRLFAEAAPDAFLEAVGVGMSGDTPVLRCVFEDSSGEFDPMFMSSAHISIIRALEICAWSPDHFGLVVDLLASLAEIDPGGRLLNRPSASLRSILLPWYPQNSVSVQQRLDAIDGLRNRHPKVSWSLLLSVLPRWHDTADNIACPRFRNWKTGEVKVTRQEYRRSVDGICSRVLEDVTHAPDRWLKLIKKIDNLPPSVRSAALSSLDALSEEQRLPPESRIEIWDALRSLAVRHRGSASADWALPPDDVNAIEATAARLEPMEPTLCHAWLFRSHMPDLPEIGTGDDFDEHQAALSERRHQAVAEIADSHDWHGLLSFAVSTELPQIVGTALAQGTAPSQHEKRIASLLESDEDKEVQFAKGYFSQRFRTDGWEWLKTYLERNDLSPLQTARLLLCSHDYPKSWELAEQMGDEVADTFWRHFQPFGLGFNFEFVEFVVRRLITVNREHAALELIALHSRRDEDIIPSNADLVAHALESLPSHGTDNTKTMQLQHRDLEHLLEALEDSELPRERMARLEWLYLPALRFDFRPVALSEMLSERPDHFVDIIRRLFPDAPEDAAMETPSDKEPHTDEEQRKAFSRHAFRLLSEWRMIPGQGDRGTLDADVLEAWVTTAREKLRESGHLDIGDNYIGKVLARGPSDEDDWPLTLEVRDLLEKVQSPGLEESVRTELFNSRGPTSRGLDEGGDQERDLAETYFDQAKRFRERWPRTAKILRELATNYERLARSLDEKVEHHRMGK